METAMLNTILNKNRILACASALTLSVALLGGCAHSRTQDELRQQASRGPVILNPRSNLNTVELNRFLQAKQPQQFFAEIQDFNSPVVEAKIRMAGTAIEIPMEKIGGTTWRAQLSDDQLKHLAISGQKMEYKASVIARDQNGAVASSKDPISVTVTAPQFEPDAG
jgi:hypothetical protein